MTIRIYLPLMDMPLKKQESFVILDKSNATINSTEDYYPTAANTVQITVQIYSDIAQLFVQ